MDGVNDVFEIKNIDECVSDELVSIKIFNTKGEQVCRYDDVLENFQWTGTDVNGTEVPEGTYFYILSVDRDINSISQKGFIELRR